MPKNSNNNTIGTINKALSILESFTPYKYKWGVTELSKKLGVYKSGIHRILKTLEQRGYVRKSNSDGRYELGMKLFELGNIVADNLDLRVQSAPFLQELWAKTGGTVALRILENNELLTLNIIESPDVLKVSHPISIRLPYNYGSYGKVLLAYLNGDKLDNLLKEKSPVPLTHKTIVDRNKLKEHLKLVRKRGYAISDEEGAIGVRSLSAPVRDSYGKVIAAVGVSFPVFKFPLRKIKEVAKIVIRTAEEISKSMGYREQTEIETGI